MLRACVLDLKGSRASHLPLVEFAYNNSYHSSIKAAPYEALYGRKYRSPVCWDEVGERKILGPEIIQRTCEKVNMICDRLRAAQSRQKSYYNIKMKRLNSIRTGCKLFGLHQPIMTCHIRLLLKLIVNSIHLNTPNNISTKTSYCN